MSVHELELIGLYKTHSIDGLIDDKGNQSTIKATFNSNPADTPSDISLATNPIAWTNTNAPLHGLNTSTAISDQFAIVRFSNLDISSTYTVSFLFNPNDNIVSTETAEKATNFFATASTGAILSASYHLNTPSGNSIHLPITDSSSTGESFSPGSGWILTTVTFTGTQDFSLALDSQCMIAGLSLGVAPSLPEPASTGLVALGIPLLFRRKRP